MASESQLGEAFVPIRATLDKLDGDLAQARNKVGGAVKVMENASGKAGGIFKDLNTQFDNLKKQVPALGTAFNLLTNPLTLATVGIGALALESKKSISELVTYNKTVREMMQVTGLSADETSRIIQVADDWGIELGTVRNALELMNKKGVTPSIDKLIQIADEYVNATDKSAFMEEATKKYGKSFGDLIPILAKGGDALREQTGAISDNMLATDESIASTRKWEVELDDFKDTVQGLEYSFAKGLLPTFIDVLKAINDVTGGMMEEQSAGNKLKRAVEAGTISRKEYNTAMWSLRIGTKAYIDILQGLTYREAIEKQKQEELNAESDKLDHIRATLTTTTDEAVDAEDELARATAEATEKEKLAQEAADRLNQKYDDLNSAINGRLGPSIEEFNKSQGELQTEMDKVKGKIDILNGMEYLTDDQQTELDGLKGDYDKLKTQYGENATAHEEATKRILFDILEQRLSLGTLTDDEETLLERIGVDWGLLDQATVDVMNRYDEAGKYLATHKGDWDNAEKIINGQETAWSLAQKAARNAYLATDDYLASLNNLDGKTVTTHIHTVYDEEHRTYFLPGGASEGANFIVPPGYPNDSYPMRVESGERVIVIPEGERFGDALETIRNLISQSIMGSRGIADAMPDLSNLKLPAMELKGIDIFGGAGMAMFDHKNQLQSAANPLTINLYAVPEKEKDMRRQARYIAEEIQRRQS